MLHHEQGVTLVELLIVVAVIGIIAVIAVPNLLEAIQRSRVNRTFADFSSIKTAIATYMIDQNRYPIASDIRPVRSIAEPLSSALLPQYYYIGNLKDAWGRDIMYTSDAEGQSYVIISPGADKALDRPDGMGRAYWRTVWWGDRPWRYRKTGTNNCRRVAYEDMSEVIKKGCDLVILNGQYLETRP